MGRKLASPATTAPNSSATRYSLIHRRSAVYGFTTKTLTLSLVAVLVPKSVLSVARQRNLVAVLID